MKLEEANNATAMLEAMLAKAERDDDIPTIPKELNGNSLLLLLYFLRSTSDWDGVNPVSVSIRINGLQDSSALFALVKAAKARLNRVMRNTNKARSFYILTSLTSEYQHADGTSDFVIEMTKSFSRVKEDQNGDEFLLQLLGDY